MRGWKRFDRAEIQCMDCGKIIGYSVAYNSQCVNFNYHINHCNDISKELYLHKVEENIRNGKSLDRIIMEVAQVLCVDCQDKVYQALLNRRKNRTNIN